MRLLFDDDPVYRRSHTSVHAGSLGVLQDSGSAGELTEKDAASDISICQQCNNRHDWSQVRLPTLLILSEEEASVLFGLQKQKDGYDWSRDRVYRQLSMQQCQHAYKGFDRDWCVCESFYASFTYLHRIAWLTLSFDSLKCAELHFSPSSAVFFVSYSGLHANFASLDMSLISFLFHF